MNCRVASGLSAVVLCAWAVFAGAQTYPVKPVRVVVMYAPGGGSDILARLVGPRLAQDLGQQFVIDNRSGGNSIIGTQIVAKAPPDGYTIGLIDTAFAINAALYDKLPYDTAKDFTAVAPLATSPFMLVVHPSTPAQSVKELIALAKAKPGQIAFASAGTGTGTRIASDQLKLAAGIEITQVPYKGGNPAAVALLSGEVQASFATLPIMFNHVKAGKVRVLAFAGPRRFALLPDVPTLAESGITGVDASGFWGIVAPAATPRPVVERLNGAITKHLGSPELRERFVQLYFEPAPAVSPAAFAAEFRTLLVRWAKAVKDTGAKPD